MTATVPAGEFSEWLRGVGRDADVPCGDCNACCRASMFIHIEPEESKTIARIPRALLFSAPGRPKGHVVLGFTDQGHCPMLVDQKCSVYEARPRTCRAYDCRMFAATGIAVDPAQPEVAARVKTWEFTYASDESRKQQLLVRAAAAFLQEKRDLFPQGGLPSHPVQLAALALRVWRLFDAGKDDAAMVRVVEAELNSII